MLTAQSGRKGLEKKEELKEMLEICHRHHVYVISDEIHQDFVFGDKKQTPSYLMTEHWDEILTITAPSKTFNLAGGQNSFVIIADENLRAKWDDFAKKNPSDDRKCIWICSGRSGI